MADLIEREDFEDEMVALLLILMGGPLSIDWMRTRPNPALMLDRIQSSGADSILRRVLQKQTENFLDEIALNDRAVYSRLVSESPFLLRQYQWQLADRLSIRHHRWLAKRSAAIAFNERLDNAVRAARTEQARADAIADRRRERKDIPDPVDVYSEPDAKREASTSITEFISSVEDSGRRIIDDEMGIKITRIWRRDLRSNTCALCLALDGLEESEWRKVFDRMPPRHPYCRCFIENRRIDPPT